MSTFKWFSFFLLLVCISCSKPLPTLEGMDLHRWKEDKNACNNHRVSMREAIDGQKNKLLSLDELQVIALLGNPDQNELYSHSQKSFYYFLEPAPGCGVATDTVSEKLVIRFNATGLAKEVAIE